MAIRQAAAKGWPYRLGLVTVAKASRCSGGHRDTISPYMSGASPAQFGTAVVTVPMVLLPRHVPLSAELQPPLVNAGLRIFMRARSQSRFALH